MSAQPEVVPSSASARGHLFVSTALDTWFTEHAAAFARDVQIDDIAYRRLDPEYYAWLRSRMMLAKTAASAGQIGIDAFDELRHRFNAIHQWAVDHFGEQALIAVVRGFNGGHYNPPVAETEPPQRAIVPASTDRNTVPVSPESAALVDAIRDRALGLGWKHDSLYRMRGSLRFPLGSDYGLVCYLKPGDRIGEVTIHSIEIILPNNMRQRFYNPNVDQPWIRRVSREKS
ncbi:MAG: hypothetical protein ABSH56_05260 [Bryobacteraceae bacterium]|jgi:hypothetical protein